MITENLTRPLGPLAVWQWGVVVAGGYIAYRFVRRGSSSSGSSNGGGTSVSDPSTWMQGPQGEQGPPGKDAPGATTGGNNSGSGGSSTVAKFPVVLTKATRIFDKSGRYALTLPAGSIATISKVRINGVWEYLIVGGHGINHYFATSTPIKTYVPPTVATTFVSAPSTTSNSQPLAATPPAGGTDTHTVVA